MGKKGRSKIGGGKVKTDSTQKARKVGKSGRIKRKKGDSRSMTQYAVVSKVIKQKKGGKMVFGERKCAIHSVCDCVNRANPVHHYKVYSGEGDVIQGTRGAKKGKRR